MLCELIRTPGSACFSLSVDHLFTNLGMEALVDRVITRESPPRNPIAVALSLSLSTS